MVVQNNTGFSSIKIFLESRRASVALSSARKIWTLHMPIVIPNGSSMKMLCSIESASIPLSYYTINDTNNRFKFMTQGFPKEGKIATGNYTIKTLLKAMNVITGGIELKYDAAQSKVNISFAGSSGNHIVDVPNNIYRLLGLTPGYNLSMDFFGTDGVPYYVAPNCVSLVYTSGIYVALNNVDNSNIDTGSSTQSSNVLLRIPISQPTNTYLQYFNNIGFKTLLNTQVLSSVDISLLDDNRNPMQLTANVDWSIVLRIDFEKTVQDTVEETKINKLRAA